MFPPLCAVRRVGELFEARVELKRLGEVLSALRPDLGSPEAAGAAGLELDLQRESRRARWHQHLATMTLEGSTSMMRSPCLWEVEPYGVITAAPTLVYS